MAAATASQKAKLEQRLVGGLALVFAGVLILGPTKSFLFPPKSVPAEAPRAVVSAPEPGTLPSLIQRYHERLEINAEPAPVIVARKPAPVTYTAQQLRDPMTTYLPPEEGAGTGPAAVEAAAFSAAAAGPSTPPILAVQGVVWGGAQPQALIDGKFYRPGDRVLGYPILTIDRAGVTIEHEGKPVAYSILRAAESAAHSRMR